MPVLGPKNTITRSATSFILSALRLVGSLRSGQNLSNSELTDAAQVLNDMLDAWGAERVMVFTIPYTTLDQNAVALALKASQQKYSLGNSLGTEDFLIPRPPRIERVSVLYSASQSLPIEVPLDMLDSVGWQALPNKTTTSILPQACYVEADPDAVHYNLFFWPVPTQGNPIVLYPWAALSQFPNLQAQFQFPPRYAEAIRFNLALRLAAEFPCDLQKLQLVKDLAREAKAGIASLNSPVKEAWCDPAIVGAGGPRGNIFTGSPSRSHGF